MLNLLVGDRTGGVLFDIQKYREEMKGREEMTDPLARYADLNLHVRGMVHENTFASDPKLREKLLVIASFCVQWMEQLDAKMRDADFLPKKEG